MLRHEVKRAADVQVGDIDVPMTVRPRRAGGSPCPFCDGLPLTPLEQPGRLQHPIDARRADGHHIGVEHHVGQAAIAFQGMIASRNSMMARFSQSSSQWSRGIQPLCSLTLPYRFFPVVERPLGHAHPAEDLFAGDLGLVVPVADVIDDRVAGVVGNPDFRSGFPKFFF